MIQTPSKPFLGHQGALRAGLALGETGYVILLRLCPSPLPDTNLEEGIRTGAQLSLWLVNRPCHKLPPPLF